MNRTTITIFLLFYFYIHGISQIKYTDTDFISPVDIPIKLSGTFGESRRGLLERGISVKNDPFDPRSSILAGSWYLDRMYTLTEGGPDRGSPASWRKALEFYYAGPGNGKKPEPLVIVYSGGTRRVIDKSAYSEKVLEWANLLRKYG